MMYNLPNHTHTGSIKDHKHYVGEHTHKFYTTVCVNDKGKGHIAQDTTDNSSSRYVPNLLTGLVQHYNWGSSDNPLKGTNTYINGNNNQDNIMSSPTSTSITGKVYTSDPYNPEPLKITIDASGGKVNPNGSPDSIIVKEPSYYTLAFIIKVQ